MLGIFFFFCLYPLVFLSGHFLQLQMWNTRGKKKPRELIAVSVIAGVLRFSSQPAFSSLPLRVFECLFCQECSGVSVALSRRTRGRYFCFVFLEVEVSLLNTLCSHSVFKARFRNSIIRLSLRLPACDSWLSFGTRCPGSAATHLTLRVPPFSASQTSPLPRARILVLSRLRRPKAVRKEVVTLIFSLCHLWSPASEDPSLAPGNYLFLG